MTGKEQTAKKVPAPRLRFPGFTGEWEERKLGEIAAIVMGSAPSSTAYNDSGNGLPLIQGNADIKNRLTIKRIYTTEITKEGSEGDVILSVRAPVGTVALTKFKVCLGRGVAALRSNSSQEFLYQALLNKEDSWKSVVQGGTFEAVTSQEVKSFPIPLPPTLPEQTRIAAALSSLDAVIAAHQSKQDALREHKRGLMAGLFPAEGERVPRLRFPEFEGAGEWEEKKLGEIAMMSSGGTPSSSVAEYYGGEIPWVSISDMTKSGKYLDNTERSLTPLGLKNSAAKVFPEETILFAMYASIGKCNIAALPVSTSQAILGIIPIDDMSVEYIYYFLAGNEDKYADMGQHGTQKNLNAGMVKALPIPLPPSLPEQTRIAACLSSLDSLIAAQGDHIAALQTFKRGLMQGLFPAAAAGPSTPQETSE